MLMMLMPYPRHVEQEMMTHRSGSKVSSEAVTKDDPKSPRNASLLDCCDGNEDEECGTTNSYA